MPEIRNQETLFGTVKNEDGSPKQEVVNDDGKVVQTIENKENLFGTVRNDDGSPVKEVKSKD
jgi:hypothetical protein